MTTMLRTLLLITLVACASSNNKPDAGGDNPDGSGLPVDAFGGPSFGELCTTSDQCQAGGYCVDGANDDVCTYGCDAGCPEGWNCRVTDVAGQLVSLCMPQKFDFCKPCTEDIQCNGGVCVQLDGEGYCLADCPFEGSCPNGYTCNPDPTNEHTGNYCVPDTGSCTCNAQFEGQVRTCQTMNGAGTCYGLETCMPNNGGWTGCTATTASTEMCDGLDNDCDQLIDDGVSGSACPITNGFGTCQGVALCTGTQVTCQGQTPAAEICNGFDDNCSGTQDELWPTLGTQCNPGVGACQRFGVFRCNSAGNGVECSETMGTPQNELCNGLDDDCDTSTDEAFKTPNLTTTALGATCSTGVGACARTGNYVCAPNGASTTCSVTAGTGSTETCNGVDDNCNGAVDETFKNASGIYNQNTSCGSCATDCTVIYGLPNATGVCTAGTTSASCSMQCAPGAFNLDGQTANGCELVLDPTAIYVSTNDVAAANDAGCGLGPVGTGTGNHPCLTIAFGLTRATQTGRANVFVANGIYAEAVTLVSGKNLLGGYAPDNWQRNVAGTGTLITGVATIGGTNHDYTVQAISITATTKFEGFVVIGGVNTKISGNSYAIYVAGSSNALSIVNNVVYGGRGGPGQGAGAGTAGLGGVDGVGRPSNPTGYDAKLSTGTAPCEAASNDRAYSNGGQQSCGSDNVSGGNGGGNRCRPTYDTEFSGIDGVTGQLGDPTLGGAAGVFGDAGDDALLGANSNMPNAGETCYVPTMNKKDYGLDGEAGRDATHGSAGAGCTGNAGTITNGHWVGLSGGNGGIGGNGGGGGGGGAGGGARCAVSGVYQGVYNCKDGRDRIGGHGGGGGSGGCGGTGGTGAISGGGSFAIFIASGPSAPVVSGNSLIRGEGGTGGNGGAGGNGGPGGVGAAGGTSAVFCANAAGRGGNGGDGGHGAGGGGGCGGGSFGIFTNGIGSPNYCSGTTNSISSGSGGAGGAGGYSLINQGGAGATGALATCQFN